MSIISWPSRSLSHFSQRPWSETGSFCTVGRCRSTRLSSSSQIRGESFFYFTVAYLGPKQHEQGIKRHCMCIESISYYIEFSVVPKRSEKGLFGHLWMLSLFSSYRNARYPLQDWSSYITRIVPQGSLWRSQVTAFCCAQYFTAIFLNLIIRQTQTIAKGLLSNDLLKNHGNNWQKKSMNCSQQRATSSTSSIATSKETGGG